MSLLTPIYNSLNSLLGRVSVERADKLDALDNLDATTASRAPADTALTNATWTDDKAGWLDAAISSRLAGTDARLNYLANLNAAVTTRAAAVDYTAARAAKLDNLNDTVSSRASATDYTATRAAKLDKLDQLISSRSTTADIWTYASRSIIKSVQHGTIQLTTSTLTGTATITAVNTSKSFIVLSCSGPWVTDNQSRLRLSLTNSTTITATRTSSGLDQAYGYQSAIYSFHVVEFM